jgi:hypothetical protein
LKYIIELKFSVLEELEVVKDGSKLLISKDRIKPPMAISAENSNPVFMW